MWVTWWSVSCFFWFSLLVHNTMYSSSANSSLWLFGWQQRIGCESVLVFFIMQWLNLAFIAALLNAISIHGSWLQCWALFITPDEFALVQSAYLNPSTVHCLDGWVVKISAFCSFVPGSFVAKDVERIVGYCTGCHVWSRCHIHMDALNYYHFVVAHCSCFLEIYESRSSKWYDSDILLIE